MFGYRIFCYQVFLRIARSAFDMVLEFRSEFVEILQLRVFLRSLVAHL